MDGSLFITDVKKELYNISLSNVGVNKVCKFSPIYVTSLKSNNYKCINKNKFY